MSSFEVVGGAPVVVAPEEIDITNAGALRSAILEAAAHGSGTLVVDMTATRFCDSSGIYTLLAAHKRVQADGGGLLLAISHITVLRVFQITGLDCVIPNVTSLDQALAQASAVRPGARRPVDGTPDSGHGDRFLAQHGTSQLPAEAR